MEMTTIKCPACLGGKQVMKLGGIFGDCNRCLGKGEILQAVQPKKEEEIISVKEPKMSFDELGKEPNKFEAPSKKLEKMKSKKIKEA